MTDRFKGTSVELVSRRLIRHTQQKSKVCYEICSIFHAFIATKQITNFVTFIDLDHGCGHAEKHDPNVFKLNQTSRTPAPVTTTKRIYSAAATDNDLLLNSIISFSKTSTNSEKRITPLKKSTVQPLSTHDSSNFIDSYPYKQIKQSNQLNKS